jgi:hypothetical protein
MRHAEFGRHYTWRQLVSWLELTGDNGLLDSLLDEGQQCLRLVHATLLRERHDCLAPPDSAAEYIIVFQSDE